MNELWCCICALISEEKRPQNWANSDNPIVIIAGSSFCFDHIEYADSSAPAARWFKDNE